MRSRLLLSSKRVKLFIRFLHFFYEICFLEKDIQRKEKEVIFSFTKNFYYSETRIFLRMSFIFKTR
jgi:hypothetical protein